MVGAKPVSAPAPAAEPSPALRVLHAASEIYPWVKTGGLADVAAALPDALARLNDAGGPIDARIVVPGYPAIIAALAKACVVAEIGPLFGAGRIRVLRGHLPGFAPLVYVVDAPSQYARAGGPYLSPEGTDWPDNLARFAALSWVAAYLALGDLDRGWSAHVLHAHDWHAALACAYLKAAPPHAVRCVFTVHNLAFQGLFGVDRLAELRLPARFATIEALEFRGEASCMKSGLALSDAITTVSPTYALEIQTSPFGQGLDGLLRTRSGDLRGIVNGVDYRAWNPATDALLPARFSAERLGGKATCKRELRQRFALPALDGPVFGVVSRLSEQKGIDWLVHCIESMVQRGAQLIVLGTGERALEVALREAAARHPEHVALHLGYDEALAHLVYAGADVLPMPSRFEPCGLSQLYAMAYGTVPLARATGGLADTVMDAGVPAAPHTEGTGFLFYGVGAPALTDCIDRALAWWQHPAVWRALQRRAMRSRFTWEAAARQYADLYRTLV